MLDLALGAHHTCALLARGLYCWGENRFGQVGDGSGLDRPTPVRIATGVDPDGTPRVAAIAAGPLFTCAAQHDGTVWCWGANDTGQMGGGVEGEPHREPGLVGMERQALPVLSAGNQHACAAVEGGEVICWGGNVGCAAAIPELPKMPAEPSRPVPPTVMEGLRDVTRVAAGFAHTCVVGAARRVWCWGSSGNGVLGVPRDSVEWGGLPARRCMPEEVAGIERVVALAACAHVCAIVDEGGLLCWGAGEEGQLGDGATTRSRHTPQAVPDMSEAWDVCVGEDHTCAVVEGGDVYCWGSNEYRQVGPAVPEGTIVVADPTRVPLPHEVERIRCGTWHTCAAGGRRLWCWGLLSYGDYVRESVPVPTEVLFP